MGSLGCIKGRITPQTRLQSLSIMKLAATSLLPALAFISTVAAQASFIRYPTAGTSVKRGRSTTVQLVRPVRPKRDIFFWRASEREFYSHDIGNVISHRTAYRALKKSDSFCRSNSVAITHVHPPLNNLAPSCTMGSSILNYTRCQDDHTRILL